MSLSDEARNAACTAIIGLLDGGSIQIYTGSQPDSPDDDATGDLLGTLTFGATAFNEPAGGVAIALPIAGDLLADASGTAGYARLLTSGGDPVMDLDIGQGTGTLSFDDVTFEAGGTIEITDLTITVN